jgi:hypothetical protein
VVVVLRQRFVKKQAECVFFSLLCYARFSTLVFDNK